MRQFILADGYNDNLQLGVSEGEICLFQFVDGVMTSIPGSGSDKIKGAFQLVLNRLAKNGGPIVIPMHSNRFRYTKAVTEAATKYHAEITIPAPTTIGDYTLIIVKKGTKFNERNKWSGIVHVRDLSMTATVLAEKIASALNNNYNHGTVVTTNGAKVVVDGINTGEDYELLAADELMGLKPSVQNYATTGFCDQKYIVDMMDKAAAEIGYEYTYREAYTDLYPNYPFGSHVNKTVDSAKFVLYTLNFATPRDVKTRDEVVNQIVQVGFKCDDPSELTEFDTILDRIES